MSKKDFNKKAIFVNGPLFDRKLGRLEFGYIILENDIAEQWIAKFSDKVKEVTPEEVAAIYGSKHGTN